MGFLRLKWMGKLACQANYFNWRWFNLIITLCGFGCCAYVAIQGQALPATGIAAGSGVAGALAAFSQRKLEAITQVANTQAQG